MSEIVNIIKSEYELRVITESLSRINLCLDKINYKEVWHRENPNTNAVGNLILHLCGNIRQYIISGIGGEPDTRKRGEEFSTERNRTKAMLREAMTSTFIKSNQIVQSLNPDDFTTPVIIQGFSHTRLSAIIHVIEHLSYHTGQITYYTKYIKAIDTNYYGDQDLDITN